MVKLNEYLSVILSYGYPLRANAVRIRVYDLQFSRITCCTHGFSHAHSCSSVMADHGASVEEQDWEDGRPEYLREVSDLRFLNISIKTYEKKTGGGFPREEYYAYRIISMYVLT